jgi:hypothetical protein
VPHPVVIFGLVVVLSHVCYLLGRVVLLDFIMGALAKWAILPLPSCRS